MPISRILTVIGIVILTLASGCAAAESTQNLPTATRVKPTETPIPPTITATSPPPTTTGIPPTEISTPTLEPTETREPTETPVPSNTLLPPTKTPRPTATPIPLPEGVESAILKTTDGFDLIGYLHTPENPVAEPIAVLLAHEYYSSHISWEAFAERLIEAGFSTLTFDFRGHGDSPGTKDFSSVGMDVKAAIRYLNQQGFEQIVCMGASMGGTGCMAAAAEMELIGLANLSGPQDLGAGRLVTRQYLEDLTIPKIFMITEEDQAGPDFVTDFIKMVEMAAEPKEFYLYPGYAHASGLLFDEFGDEVQEILLNFVKDFSQSAVPAADYQPPGLPETAWTGVSTNDEWEPVIREFGGIPMALVPAGCFKMGNNDGFAEMQPAHQICFDRPFWIDHTEVTVGQFADFLNGQDQPIDNYEKWLNIWGVTFEPHIQLDQDNGHWIPLPDDGNRPLENVTWFGAFDYCAWRNARLPGESEWEYAARGPDNLLYPWGNEFARDNIVRFEGKNPEVGSKPQGTSWVGALDMSGSMFEWTNSLYMPYPYDPSDGREASFESDGGDRVFRGSAWYHPERMKDDLTATARLDAPPEYAAWYYGFRCVRSSTP